MAELPPFDPYEVLGVDKTSDAGVIKKAYRKLALLKHPDKCGDEALKQIRTDEFQRLNEAYDILGDDEKRQRHDALVKLEAMRKERNAFRSSAAPRPFQRSSTFSSGHSAASPYPPRAANYEDRAPRYQGDSDDYLKGSNRYTYDHSPRSPPTQSRRDRVRADRVEREAEERRRAEKRREREAEQRESRSRKHEHEQDRYATHSEKWEDEKRRRDDEERTRKSKDALAQKYEDMVQNAHQYTQETRVKPESQTKSRPNMSRRTSTREVPSSFMGFGTARRSQAQSKERVRERSDRDVDKEGEILERERQKRDKLREQLLREREARDRKRDEEYASALREERERREDRDRRETERIRLAEAARAKQSAREQEKQRECRTRSKENVEPYEKRPPILQTHHSSPPFKIPETSPRTTMPTRAKTEQINNEPTPSPAFSRASTMPTMPTTSSTRRGDPLPGSRLRDTVLPDSGYSSSSTTASDGHAKPAKPAQPVKTEKRFRVKDGRVEPVIVERPIYRTETREPPSSRRRSPSMERPSATAAKMANLATSRVRPSTSYGSDKASGRPSTSYGGQDRATRPSMVHSNSSRAVPRSSRSPERSSRHEREREATRQKHLFGSLHAGHSSGEPYKNVSYSKRYDENDVQYSRAEMGRRDRDQDPYSRAPHAFPRSTTMPMQGYA